MLIKKLVNSSLFLYEGSFSIIKFLNQSDWTAGFLTETTERTVTDC